MLGLASNMDQHLNMAGVVRLGAGILLRCERARPAAIRAAVMQMLDDSAYAEAAARSARIFSSYDAAGRFQEIVTSVSKTST